MLAAMVIMMMLCNWYDGNENVVGDVDDDDDDADTVSGGGLMAYFCRWHFKKAIKEFKNVGIVFLVVFFLGLYFENTSYKKRTSQSS
jgi:uncharacterized protein YodC (DUF2158 family)